MHPLLLYIVANTAGNIHRDRASAHVSIGLTITGKGSSAYLTAKKISSGTKKTIQQNLIHCSLPLYMKMITKDQSQLANDILLYILYK